MEIAFSSEFSLGNGMHGLVLTMVLNGKVRKDGVRNLYKCYLYLKKGNILFRMACNSTSKLFEFLHDILELLVIP